MLRTTPRKSYDYESKISDKDTGEQRLRGGELKPASAEDVANGNV
jgi:hypothetical protein